MSCPPPRRPAPVLRGKRGICFTLREEGEKGSWTVNLPKVIALKPYWNYSWNSKRLEQQPDDIEFVPMIWGAWGAQGLQKKINEDVVPPFNAGQTQLLLGFNEPDNDTQANMSVEKAAGFWSELEAADMPLASPVCVHADGKWMKDFMAKEGDSCMRIDIIAVHWYGSPSFGNFKSHMEKVHNLYQRPIILTEFAPADWSAKKPEDNKLSQGNVLDFMKKALPWLETTEWIVGYAWFPFEQSSGPGTASALFDAEGAMTPLGEYYMSVTNENPQGNQDITA